MRAEGLGRKDIQMDVLGRPDFSCPARERSGEGDEGRIMHRQEHLIITPSAGICCEHRYQQRGEMPRDLKSKENNKFSSKKRNQKKCMLKSMRCAGVSISQSLGHTEKLLLLFLPCLSI